jgi:hypothetical protein
MPIVIQENNSNLFPIVDVGINNFQFEPPTFYKFKVIQDGSPNSFSIDAFFPKFDSMNTYQGFSNFIVVITPTFQQPISFLLVENESSFTGDLGDEFANYYKKTVEFNFTNNDLLSSGNYLSVVRFEVFATNPQGDVVSIQRRNFSVFQDVTAEEVPRLQIVSRVTNFIFYYAGVLPASQSFYIFSNQSFTINNADPDLVDITETSFGLYKKITFTIKSAAADLTEDTQVLITIADDELILPIQLLRVNIVLVDVEESLEITPSVLNVTRQKGIADSEPLFVNVFSTNPWEIISGLPNWIQLNAVVTPALSTLYLTISSELLQTAGTYSFTILFSNGVSTAELVVNLELLEYIDNPFISGQYYFTKDLDYIRFSSQEENTYMEITVNSEFYKPNFSESFSYERKYSIPLLFGKGDFHLGSVLDGLFYENKKMFLSPGLNFNYKPAKVSFTIQEKYYDSEDVIDENISVNNIYFILGKSPFITSSGLAILTSRKPGLHRITANSIFCLSYMSIANSEIVIKKNGNVIEQLVPLSFVPGAILQTYLKYIENLKVGDLLEFFISYQNETIPMRFLVHSEGLNTANFIFKNQNGVFDAIELTGRYRVGSNYTHTFFSKFQNLFSVDEKLKTINRQSFVVNTGLLTLEESTCVDALIKSDTIYLSVGLEEAIPVSCVSNRIVLNDSSENTISYDLEFNLQTDSDAVFFIR